MTTRHLPTRTLPERPDLEQLKRQAKELLQRFADGEAAAVTEVNAQYRDADPRNFALHDAQLVLARAYGFESWPKLKAFVDGVTVTRLIEAVRAGDLVFVSGCTGANQHPNDSRAQIRLAYQYVAEVLEAADASWDDVVSITTYHLDMQRYIDDVLEIHREFVKTEPYPTWTAVGVTELYEPEAIFEVSAIARVQR